MGVKEFESLEDEENELDNSNVEEESVSEFEELVDSEVGEEDEKVKKVIKRLVVLESEDEVEVDGVEVESEEEVESIENEIEDSESEV